MNKKGGRECHDFPSNFLPQCRIILYGDPSMFQYSWGIEKNYEKKKKREPRLSARIVFGQFSEIIRKEAI